jgi:hypothetical protein
MAWPGGTTWGATAPATGTGLWLSQSTPAYDPGMPFGQYKLCVVDRSNGTRQAVLTALYDNRTPDGGATLDIPLNSVSTVSGWSSTVNNCASA